MHNLICLQIKNGKRKFFSFSKVTIWCMLFVAVQRNGMEDINKGWQIVVRDEKDAIIKELNLSDEENKTSFASLTTSKQASAYWLAYTCMWTCCISCCEETYTHLPKALKKRLESKALTKTDKFRQ